MRFKANESKYTQTADSIKGQCVLGKETEASSEESSIVVRKQSEDENSFIYKPQGSAALTPRAQVTGEWVTFDAHSSQLLMQMEG